MIIDNRNVVCISTFPYEANTPLIVDSNAMLTGSITLELLKLIRRWNEKGFQLACRSEHFQLPGRKTLNAAWKLTRKTPLINPLSFPAPEGLDHYKILSHYVSNVKR